MPHNAAVLGWENEQKADTLVVSAPTIWATGEIMSSGPTSDTAHGRSPGAATSHRTGGVQRVRTARMVATLLPARSRRR